MAFAYRLLPDEDRDSAEDIVQDALYRVTTGTDPAQIADKLNFVYKVIQNLCFDRYRSRLQPASIVCLDAPQNPEREEWYMQLRDPGRDPELNAEINEQVENFLRRLAANCADLSEREKKLLSLRLQGWTNEEIARALHVGVTVVRLDMNKVVAKIRYRLKRTKEKSDCF
jgi:RNA polymerase sigma factor (sigma-70 family)